LDRPEAERLVADASERIWRPEGVEHEPAIVAGGPPLLPDAAPFHPCNQLVTVATSGHNRCNAPAARPAGDDPIHPYP
jgi:hypothetical protein